MPQAAQKLAPLLEFLRQHTGAGIQLVLHPAPELSDLPLKSYYRYALPVFAPTGTSCVEVASPAMHVSELVRLDRYSLLSLRAAWLRSCRCARLKKWVFRQCKSKPPVSKRNSLLGCLPLTGPCWRVRVISCCRPPVLRCSGRVLICRQRHRRAAAAGGRFRLAPREPGADTQHGRAGILAGGGH